MLRALGLAMLLLAMPRAVPGQATGVLHIKVTLVDADGKVTPVPRCALLISDNPATTAPRRIVTALDGTAEVKLRTGNYTVESDQPVAFQEHAYEWRQTLDIAAGRDAVLELTRGNAEVGPVTAAMAGAPSAPRLEADTSALLMQWQQSVVGLWTETTHASGFAVDASGLIATNQRAIGSATAVEVQISPAVKVAGRVLVSDASQDVAVVWIDPAALEAVRPVPLGCAAERRPALASGQEIFTIGVPLREDKGLTSGTATRVELHHIATDLQLAAGSAGGPVFTADGAVVGVTSVSDSKETRDNPVSRRSDFRIVPTADVCSVLATAQQKAKEGPPPGAARLPVESATPFPMDALRTVARSGTRTLVPYQMAAADFDVSFITPVLTYAARYKANEAASRERRTTVDETSMRTLLDFANWDGYVVDSPPVLLVRVTPKMVEGFWTTVARGAASTQGVSVPPIKHFKSGFGRLQAYCGDAEVTPVHPFKLAQRIAEGNAIYEGLYAFDPGALGPQCGTVKLVLYSEKEPQKADSRVVDPKVVQQIWDDFAAYRAAK